MNPLFNRLASQFISGNEKLIRKLAETKAMRKTAELTHDLVEKGKAKAAEALQELKAKQQAAQRQQQSSAHAHGQGHTTSLKAAPRVQLPSNPVFGKIKSIGQQIREDAAHDWRLVERKLRELNSNSSSSAGGGGGGSGGAAGSGSKGGNQ